MTRTEAEYVNIVARWMTGHPDADVVEAYMALSVLLDRAATALPIGLVRREAVAAAAGTDHVRPELKLPTS